VVGKEPVVGVTGVGRMQSRVIAGVFWWVVGRRHKFMETEEVEGWGGEATGRQGGETGR
jgi:hypothetical protein